MIMLGCWLICLLAELYTNSDETSRRVNSWNCGNSVSNGAEKKDATFFTEGLGW